MQLEDYFDFQRPDDIRVKGHRIGIENVLYEYIHRAQTPEEIVRTYPTLTLEQVYASLLPRQQGAGGGLPDRLAGVLPRGQGGI